MRDSWKLIVTMDKRPKKQQNNINLKNVFATALRDTGKLALIDGDTCIDSHQGIAHHKHEMVDIAL